MPKPVTFTITIVGSLLFCFLTSATSFATDKATRIAYVEAGEYWTYTETYNAIKEYLEINWENEIEYPSDAHISPGWDKKKELKKRAQKLMERSDIDIIISAGTAATATVLELNNKKTPILAMAVADAVRSKFVINAHDSGVDNFTVRIVPGRYKRMFEIFHEVIGFRKLGLIYPDNEEGHTYSNIEDAKQVAREIGFKIINYDKISNSETTEDCYSGIQNLLDQGIDAFFIPALNCFDWKTSDVAFLLDILSKHKIPTFAREGNSTVKTGALMGFSTYDFSARGSFLGKRIVKILNGTKPRALTMIDIVTPRIAFNLKVASEIGFDPPIALLGASDVIYLKTILPEDRFQKMQ